MPVAGGGGGSVEGAVLPVPRPHRFKIISWRLLGSPWLDPYGHYVIFATAAAIGAGLEVAVEQATGHASISAPAAAAAVTVPTALFLTCVHLIHTRPHITTRAHHLGLPVAALAILACTRAGAAAIPLTGVICTLATATVITPPKRRHSETLDPLLA
ncbi:low temperature requirement protein A [Streptomyces cinereoruber]|uniref:low temperature requirement protein A n=1 Tax=Streptomyces cinereoruber TaxID=67260 RepID=UPI003635330B